MNASESLQITETGNVEFSATDSVSSEGETAQVDEVEPESTLPAQALVSRRGRPATDAVLVEGDPDGDGPLRYIGADGHYHTETPRARKAFEDYLNMGPSRTLKALATRYTNDKPEGWELANSELATLRKLSEYSSNLGWQNRIRLRLQRESALVVTNAHKQASRNRVERMRRAKKLQDIAEHIFDQARILDTDSVELPPEVARMLIKPAIQMMEIGMIQERVEAGESLERIKPPKPIDQMTEEELDEYIDLLRTER